MRVMWLWEMFDYGRAWVSIGELTFCMQDYKRGVGVRYWVTLEGKLCGYP